MPREIIIEAPELRLDAHQLADTIDWGTLLDGPGPVEIEIGIGKGRFLLASAVARPDVRHLGIEWANKYLRIAESRAKKRDLENVRFLRADAKELLPHIPDASVDAYYVFYPDPWPKKRHLKRRFLQPPVADALARTLIPGGLLHVATDHAGYWETIEPLFDEHDAYERVAWFGGREFPLAVEEPLTNFEAKYQQDGRRLNRASWERRR